MNIVKILFEENENKEKYTIIELDNGDIVAELYTKPSKKYYDEINDINKMITDYDNYYKEIKQIPNQPIKIIRDRILNGENFYQSFDCLILSGTHDEVISFLENNPELIGKKIIIENINYKKSDLKTIQQLSKYDNIYINSAHNMSSISIEQYLETYNKITPIIKAIKQYNLSPIEQLMYVYDIVRDRVYVEETLSEDVHVSRDLTSVLTGDKIVCAGFANMFDEIVKQLEFKSQIYSLKVNDDFHARNLVYVNDEKYDIKGLYFFDPTWDSKRSENDNTYLKSYKYFAKTKLEMDEYYIFEEEDCSSLFSDMGIEYSKNDNLDIMKTISNLSKLFDGKYLDMLKILNHDEEVKQKAYEYATLADNPIELDKFKNIFITVRAIEHINDSKYRVDSEEIKDVLNGYQPIEVGYQIQKLLKFIGII